MTNKRQLTLGSLFDGSGGFPLGGLLAGIKPVWASEVEPFAVRVTTKRLPEMKHYGDVSATHGGEMEPVDIITFGSPCQDMSIAGKRAGLEGEKSSLFHEAIRIIKEMREATNGEKPRWICFENVPGAFSSNKGEDFRQVLQEIIRIKEPNAEVPAAGPAGWPYADTYLGDGWSVAYRTLDAQYFGVPQRRRRIFLVADFAGQGAPEVLFKSESVSGYTSEGFRAWQRAAGYSAQGTGAAGGDGGNADGGITAGGNTVTSTLYAAYGTKWNGNAGAMNGDNFVAEPLAVDGYNGDCDETAATLGENCGMSTGRNGVMVLNDQGGSRMDVTDDVTSTLRAEAHHPPVVMGGELPGSRDAKACGFCTEHSAKSRSIGFEEEKSPTLRAGVVPAAVFENHSQDTRYTGPLDTAPTVNATYGMGGNNQPFVVDASDEPDVSDTGESDVPVTLKIRSGCAGGGKGPIWRSDQSATLGCNNDQTVFVPFAKGTRPHSAEEGQEWKEAEVANTLNTFDIGESRCNELAVEQIKGCAWDGTQTVGTLTDKNARGVQRMPDKGNFNCVLEPQKEKTAFGISSKDSNAMKSPNPHAGIYEATTSRTLDSAGGNPSANQGGICIVEAAEPVAFTQNQRAEVRDLGGKAGALAAEPGMKQQTFIAEPQEETTAFHVNQRDEVIDLHGVSGALMATRNNQMQTFVLQGSMIGRDDRNGPQGDGVNEDVSFTLNTIDRHAVCAPEEKDLYAMTTGSYMEVVKDQSPTLMARDYKDPTTIAPVEPPAGQDAVEPHQIYSRVTGTVMASKHPSGFNGQDAHSDRLVVDNPKAQERPTIYTVRRLTPTECARLQGFPDWWCSNLGTENPTAEDIAFWTEVFETHRRVVTKTGKPKTEKQIIKWLKDPYSDSAEYRLWGNGICLPVVVMLMYGIVWADSLTDSLTE